MHAAHISPTGTAIYTCQCHRLTSTALARRSEKLSYDGENGEVVSGGGVHRGAAARGVGGRHGGAAGGGLDHHALGVRQHAEAAQQRGVPGQGVLHVRRLHHRRQGLPVVRQHRRPGHPEARARRLLRPDLPRDNRRDEGCCRSVPVGLLLQGRAEQDGSTFLRTRTHSVDSPVQLRGRREGAGPEPGGRPEPGGNRPRGGLQDGHLVLDDGAGAQAVAPRRGHGPVDTVGGRPRRGALAGGVRRHHQHHQRRGGVRHGAQKLRRRPHRLLQALLQHARRRVREQPRLLQADEVRLRTDRPLMI